MGLKLEQIEHHMDYGKSKSRKFLKNNRNRKIRYVPVDVDVHIKYKGWEY